MKLPKLRIKEIDHVYLDSIEKWVEIPVFEGEDVTALVSEVDWSKQTLSNYKGVLVGHIDLESDVKAAALRYPAVRSEVYDFIINKNPGLQPVLESGHEPYHTEQEKKSVMAWFASHKLSGQRPEVIDGGAE